jgi:mannose-6-phosphate isomerase-like protein (cupin superfamily)
MTGFDPRAPVSLGAGEGDAIWYLGGLLTHKAGAETTAGAFDMIEELVPPGASPPRHIHHREDESFYVLAGRVAFFRGDDILAAEPGSYVWLPRGIPHTFRVEGVEPARLLEINTPAGLWRFFQEMGTPARERALPPAQPLDIEKLRRVAPRYGIDILGPLKS